MVGQIAVSFCSFLTIFAFDWAFFRKLLTPRINNYNVINEDSREMRLKQKVIFSSTHFSMTDDKQSCSFRFSINTVNVLNDICSNNIHSRSPSKYNVYILNEFSIFIFCVHLRTSNIELHSHWSIREICICYLQSVIIIIIIGFVFLFFLSTIGCIYFRVYRSIKQHRGHSYASDSIECVKHIIQNIFSYRINLMCICALF